MSTCDCVDEHCEHWQAREQRFIERTARVMGKPYRRYCYTCFAPIMADGCNCDRD